jgi:N-acetylmuramoyl-L-alanine amidase
MTPPFQPDSRVAGGVVASPNHGERRKGRRPDILLLHYTGMPDAEEALARLCHPASEVSAHYYVFEDGRIVQLVPEERRAWHAGSSSWDDDDDINSRSIGVEIANPGHDGGLPPFPPAQVAGVIALSGDICRRWSIPPHRVLGHSDVAPGRKRDPGERFPWAELHRAGVGHWVPPAALQDGGVLSHGDAGEAVAALQASLARYGYGLATTGVFDETTADVVAAFQRHFRPERVDGAADFSTIATLRDLLAARPQPMTKS